MKRLISSRWLWGGAALLGLLTFTLLSTNIQRSAPVMTVSVSADGQQVMTSRRNNIIELWDSPSRSRTTLSENGNIYMAHIAPEDNSLFWQDLNGTVHVLDSEGHELNRFDQAPLYSFAARHASGPFYMSDGQWQLLALKDQEACLLKAAWGSVSGLGKPLNVTLDDTGDLLLTAGYGAYYHREDMSLEEARDSQFKRLDGVTLWNANTCEPIANLPGNSAKTHATLSPDGQYVVSVDENGKSYIWSTETGERAYTIAYSYVFGKFVGGNEFSSPDNWDNSGARLNYPDDFPEGFHGGSKVAVQFISDTEYLTFYHNQPYAVLYELGDPFALDILELGERPFPAVSDYSRNAAIATAPEANVLVTGHRDGDGITVYHYDPETRTLAREWVGRSRWWWPF